MKYLNKSRSNRQTLPYGKRGATVVFEAPDGSETARVSFPASRCASINACTKKLGISLEQFFDLAIEDKIQVAECEQSAFAEMDCAIIQVEGLMQILADSLHYQVVRDGDISNQEDDSTCAGIMEVVRSSKTRLTRAFDAYRFLTHDKPLVPPERA